MVFCFFGTVRHFCLFLLKKIGFFGAVQRFCSLRPRKCCTVPKKPIFLGQKVQKCCTVPKETKKKTKFGDLGLLQGLEVSQLWFFWFFWDSTVFLLVLAQEGWFFLDSTAFLQSQASKMLYCPKKNYHLFKAKSAKVLHCPKKTKKTKVWRPWAPPGPGGLTTLVFLVFLGQYGIFACFGLKRLFFFDSTAFLQSQASKVLYCPKKTNLFKAKSAKMLYSQKNPKNQSLETLGSSRAWRSPNFGFLGFLGQYGIFACFCLKRLVFLGQYLENAVLSQTKCKNAVLSQKNPKKKKQSLETLGSSSFCLFWLKKIFFLGQYSVFAVPGLENAVLSQKNQSF